MSTCKIIKQSMKTRKQAKLSFTVPTKTSIHNTRGNAGKNFDGFQTRNSQRQRAMKKVYM